VYRYGTDLLPIGLVTWEPGCHGMFGVVREMIDLSRSGGRVRRSVAQRDTPDGSVAGLGSDSESVCTFRSVSLV